MKTKKVKSLNHLKKLCLNKQASFHIGFGMVRSSKDIYYNGKSFEIMHNIDGSCEDLTDDEMKDTNIYRAIMAGNFYYNYYGK